MFTLKEGMGTEWFHMVVVIDRSTKITKVFIDEIEGTTTTDFYNKTSLVSSLDNLGTINSTANLLIGSNGDGYYFRGIIDDLRIYNGAISD